MSIISLAALLDPCFKNTVFINSSKAAADEKMLTSKCAVVVRNSAASSSSSSQLHILEASQSVLQEEMDAF